MTTRVLVTGSRDFMDKDLMRKTLRGLRKAWPDAEILIVHGNAVGADTFADIVARELGYLTEAHPYWHDKGRAGGPMRNQHMVDLGAELCLAFPIGKSPGTRGCMEMAKRAGIPVVDVTEGKMVKTRADLPIPPKMNGI
jgi:hypothetical protein